MRMLARKLRRDLWRLKWQLLAIALLIGCGVSVAVMAFSTQKALVAAQRTYYAQTRFADVFATATRAPRSLLPALQHIDGVVTVDARAMKVGLMNVPGLLRPATVRLIALPDDDRLALNRLVVVRGRLPGPDRTDEAVALDTFLTAAHIAVGERRAMIIGNRQVSFTIVGAALSPEYVYVPSFGPMPDDAHQGVLWAPRLAVERPAGLGDAFSSVSVTLARGASTPAALTAIDRLLSPYGGAPAFARADQISHKFQEDRIQRLGLIAVIIPPIFLVVAAALVHLVLGRMVESEREQIGLLKAFGYTDMDAAAPYLKLAVAVAIIGVTAGAGTGWWLATTMIGTLDRYMRFPHLPPQLSWTALGVSAAVSIAAAVAGSLMAVRRAVRLSPAAAMQPPAPRVYRRGLVERLPLWQAIDQPTRMIVRYLERFPARSVMTIAGLAVSLTLLVASQFLYGSFDDIVDQAYFRSRHWTDEVFFGEARDLRATAAMVRLPGVLRAEPFRAAPAYLRSRGRERRIFLLGLDRNAELERTLDPEGRPVPLIGRGLTLAQAVAARLQVAPGDLVELQVTVGRRPRVLLPVTAIAQDYAGMIVHIDRDALNRILGDGDVASGAQVLVDPARRQEFYQALAATPQLAGAGSRDDTVAMFRSTITAVLTTEMTMLLGFAGAIAFGIAYNVSRISLADRARDLATLRVLGFSLFECAYILSGELLALALVALPFGTLGGLALARLMLTGFERQDFFLPFALAPSLYGLAFIVYLAAVIIAAVLVAQRVWRFELVQTLKTRE